MDWRQFDGVGSIDKAVFSDCFDSEQSRSQVRLDSIAARKLGATGTPTVLVNDWRLFGTPSFDMLDSTVRANLRR
jgi:protein-disulfide isomerase